MAFPFEHEGLDSLLWEKLTEKRKDILSIPITFEQDLDDPSFRESCLNEPIIILKNFLQHRNFSAGEFCFSRDALRVHGANKVPIVHQSTDVTGWKGLSTLHHCCTLHDYVSYVQFFEDFLDLMAHFCVDLVPCKLDKSLVHLKSLNEPLPPPPQSSHTNAASSNSASGAVYDAKLHLLVLPLKKLVTYEMAQYGSSNMIKVTHAVSCAYTSVMERVKKNAGTKSSNGACSGSNILSSSLPHALESAYVSFAGMSEADFMTINCLRHSIQKPKKREAKNVLQGIFKAHTDILSSDKMYCTNRREKVNKTLFAQARDSEQLKLQLFRWREGLCLQVVFFGTALLYHPVAPSHSGCEEAVMSALRRWLWDEEKNRVTGALLQEFVFLQSNSEGFLRSAVRNFAKCVTECKEPSDAEKCYPSVSDRYALSKTRALTWHLPCAERSVKNGRLKLGEMIACLKSGDVFFCSNVSIYGWEKEVGLLHRRFPSWMMCSSADDMMQRLRQNVDGMNTPQLYVKCPGVWTAGHQENCNLYSVNCNSGPHDSEWFCVEKCNVNELRRKVLERESVDILREEGWFPRCEWLCEMGIPFMHGVQKAGDAVLLKGETLHWVRSLGFSSHFSWNFGPMRREQLESIVQRVCVNEKMTVEGPAFQSAIPIQTLLLDIVREVYREGCLKGFIIEGAEGVHLTDLSAFCAQCPMAVCLQDKGLLLIIVRELARGVRVLREGLARCEAIIQCACRLEPEERLVVFCEERSCKREIFEVYGECDRCGYLCLGCFEKRCVAKVHPNRKVVRKRGSPSESDVVDRLIQIATSLYATDAAFVKVIAESDCINQ